MQKTLKVFDRHDWDAFAGASPLQDGSAPRIGETVDGWLVLVSGCEDEKRTCVEFSGDDGTFGLEFDADKVALIIAEYALVHGAQCLRHCAKWEV